jgi:DHA1 family multidrug resistance protein-like MFS transporter
VGGALAATIGIRPTFIGASAFYMIAFFLVLLAVDEHFERPTPEERGSLLSNIRLVFGIRPLAILIGVVFFLNMGPAFVRPIIPLLVASFDTAASPEVLAGIAFAAMAMTSAIAALSASRIADRFGRRNALVFVTFAAGVAYLPLAFASSAPVALILFAGVGLFSGAMLPTANALIDYHSPPSMQATVFGLAGSSFALAIALGPLSGGAVASAAGVPASFLVIGAVMIGVSGAVLFLLQGEGQEGEAPDQAQAPEG